MKTEEIKKAASPYIIPWEEKKKEFKKISGDESLIGSAWDEFEDNIFFFLMLMGTY